MTPEDLATLYKTLFATTDGQRTVVLFIKAMLLETKTIQET